MPRNYGRGRRLGHWRIDGVHPAEYAQRWGDGQTVGGMRFYNCADTDRHNEEVIGRPEWSADDWRAFAQTVAAKRGEVVDAIGTAEGRKRTGWSMDDVRNLYTLEQWAQYMAGRAGSNLPWLAAQW